MIEGLEVLFMRQGLQMTCPQGREKGIKREEVKVLLQEGQLKTFDVFDIDYYLLLVYWYLRYF